MKKVFVSIIAMLLPLLASADAVEIDGICYSLNLETKQAEVTKNPDGYSGDVTIPNTVTYEKVEYSVCPRRAKFSQQHRTKSVTHESAILISRQR